MIVRKPRPKSNFYMLDKAISEDRKLTWAARGLLVFLLGKPDHWQVSTQALINETKGTRAPIGRDGVRAIVGELMAAGYVQRIQARDVGGKLAGYDYHVSEECIPPETPKPGTAEPATAAPATANPPQVSIDSSVRTDGEASIDLSTQAPTALASLEVLPAEPAAKKKPKAAPLDTEFKAACRATWNAYGKAYAERYGVAPVGNAKVYTAVQQIVQRIGQAESPVVAEFFVSRVNDAFVVRKTHEIGLLLSSAESYRTQWATGQTMTATRAQQLDKTGANFSAADEAKAISRARRAAANGDATC